MTSQNLNAISSGYLQLGIAGAALFIVLVFVVLQSRNMSNKDTSSTKLQELQFSKMDKLCDKIDALITSNSLHTAKLNEVLLSNDKDQKETIKLLISLQNITMDIQKKVVRIDDRTYLCLKPKSDEINKKDGV